MTPVWRPFFDHSVAACRRSQICFLDSDMSWLPFLIRRPSRRRDSTHRAAPRLALGPVAQTHKAMCHMARHELNGDHSPLGMSWNCARGHADAIGNRMMMTRSSSFCAVHSALLPMSERCSMLGGLTPTPQRRGAV